MSEWILDEIADFILAAIMSAQAVRAARPSGCYGGGIHEMFWCTLPP